MKEESAAAKAQIAELRSANDQASQEVRELRSANDEANHEVRASNGDAHAMRRKPAMRAASHRLCAQAVCAQATNCELCF